MDTSHGLRNSLEDLEILLAVLFHLHYRSHVAASIAVVRSTPYSHKVLILEPVNVAFLHQLMSTSDQLQPIDMAEVVSNLRAEDPPSPSCIDRPILNIFRIRPHQIAERTLVGYLNLTIDGSDLINGLDLW